MKKKYNNKSQSDLGTFDIKTYFFKIIAHWKLFILFLLITFSYAYYKNISTQHIYGLSTTISVKEKSNPLFSTGTTIAFNWGGVSDKVETIKRMLTSRTHNETVVRKLNLYVEYLKEGRFRMKDVYGKTPFKVVLDTNKYQIQNTLLKVKIYTQNRYRLYFSFPENRTVSLLNYNNEKSRDYLSPKKEFFWRL